MNGGPVQKIDQYRAQIKNAGQFIGIGSGNMQTKICSRCKERLPISEFRKHSRNSIYLQCYCKKCQYLINKTRSFNNIVDSHKKRSSLPKECHDLTKEQYEKLFEIQVYGCNICGCNILFNPRHIDCIIPLSKGGALTFYNVQILCRHCNAKKYDKIIECDLHLVEKFEFKGYFTELDYKLLNMMV